jgi:hypothetical protein
MLEMSSTGADTVFANVRMIPRIIGWRDGRRAA